MAFLVKTGSDEFYLFKYVKLSGNSRTGKRFLRAEDVQNYNPGKRICHPLNCDLPVKKNKTTKNPKKQRS